MDFKLLINKNDNTPVYRQIIEKITVKVQNGELKAGDRLPPERDLSAMLDVARGTVKKAYEKLADNKIITMVQGRGSFISSEQDVLGEGRKDRAVKIINKCLGELDKLKFNSREISSLFQILLMEHELKRKSINIAGIDCNPEALSIFDMQLRHISNLKLYRFLLDNLYKETGVKERLAEFDLILTTSTHYSEVIGVLPKLKNKVVQVAVSPSQQTVIELAQIPAESKIGIVTESLNFLEIIKSKIKDFQIPVKNIVHMYEKDKADFASFIKGCNILITPPKCLLEEQKELKGIFNSFLTKGGKIIRFGYQIERGALIHIEEKISQIIKKREA